MSRSHLSPLGCCLALAAALTPAFAEVKVTQLENRVAVEIDGQPPTSFWYGPDVTKAYLYPLRTAEGVAVNRGWPMEPHPGERHDHIHHRGLWFAHSSVNGFDFWNSDPSYHNPKMGRVLVTKIDRLTSGAKTGKVEAQLSWQDPSGKELLHESRTMTFYTGDPRMVDFNITLTAAVPITFGDEKDGVLGLRLAAELEEPGKDAPADPVRSGTMTTSEGCHQEAECWGTRGSWLDVSGRLNGAAVGVSIFDHPDNPRAPTYWHARGYGLLGANIFGVKAFTHDTKPEGTMTLDTEKQLRFRYRVLIHTGDARSARIDDLYHAYLRAGTALD